MSKKIFIPLYGNEVAPRFDLASEVVMISKEQEEKMVVMSQTSAEKLCDLIISENIEVVICGGIEDEFYQYLKWKKVEVYDGVIGSYKKVLEHYFQGELQSGLILCDNQPQREKQ